MKVLLPLVCLLHGGSNMLQPWMVARFEVAVPWGGAATVGDCLVSATGYNYGRWLY
jgi:hypothetical protein